MAGFCEDAGDVAEPRVSLISSYFGHLVLIPTPLLCWYLLNGLVVTHLHLLMQYDRRRGFKSLAEDCTQKRGPIAGPSQGIGKVADDQLVREMLWEQETFLANKLYEGRNTQQGRVLQPFQGHETFAGHTSTWVGPRGHVWRQLPASEWCPWNSTGGSLRVGYGTRTSDPGLAHPDHRLCVWLCTMYMDTDS